MRTGAARDHRGYFHEAAFYGSDQEFLNLVVPFLTDGLAAGEPVVAAFGPANQSLVRAALGSADGVRFIDGDVQYARPANAIRNYRELLAECVANGATQIRVTGDVPHPGVGSGWEWWARYEAAVNHAYDEFPIWGLCPYDTRSTPIDVQGEVRRTHPYLATAGGHHRNPDFGDPASFLAGRTTRWRDPLEDSSPAVELLDPTPAQARGAVATVIGPVQLVDEDRSGLLVATSEAVTNAIVHGRAPVRVRTWVAADRVLVAVSDRGVGPADPFAGLLPMTGGIGGLGLWLAHQLCSWVTLEGGAEGFTIRLVAGRPAV